MYHGMLTAGQKYHVNTYDR